MNFMIFWKEESGQLSVDWTVLVASLVGVSIAAATSVSISVRDVTDEYDGINTGTGMMTMFAGRDDASGGGSGTGSGTGGNTGSGSNDSASGDSGGGADAAFCAGNPGNDKCVGKAGENPNGKGGWGGGTKGRSDGDKGKP